jgi:hypothetical protein
MAQDIKFYGKLWTGKISQEVREAAEYARTYGLGLIRARTPVDTGELKSKWSARIVSGGIEWSNPTPYAGFVELGTRKMAPRYMLTDSLPDIERVFRQRLRSNINKALANRLFAAYNAPNYSNVGQSNRQARGVARNVSLPKALQDNIKKAKPLWQRKL